MPNIRISKIKARRGTRDQIKSRIFDQGELVYSIDGRRLYTGSGDLSGGTVVGNKLHPPLLNYYSLSSVIAEVGDAVSINNKFYQLTAVDYQNVNSWVDISTKIDTLFFKYDSTNTLTLAGSGISASYLNPVTVSNGIKIEDGILQSKFNTKSLEISAGAISIKHGGIDEREVSSTSFYKGLTGGSGNKIGINYDPAYFYLESGMLSISAIPVTGIEFSDLESQWFGGGLVYDSFNSTISTVISSADGSSLTSNNGILSMTQQASSGTSELARITVDQFGRVIDRTNSIFSTLTGKYPTNTSGSLSTNVLSSIFNGTPSHTLSGGVSGIPLTKFFAIDPSGATVTLSSAGFITFEGNTTTRDGQTLGRFAIPIFAY